MDKADREAVKECLQHPGAKILAGILLKSADDTLRKYDKCRPEELTRLQMYRFLINEEFPRIIDGIISPPSEETSFNWRRLLGLKG